MREIKFKRAHFFDEELKKFSHYSEWGVKIKGAEFTSPSSNNFAPFFTDYQFTGLKDLKGNDIFEGDIILSSFKIRQKETKEERLIEDKIIVEWKYQEEDYEQSHFYGYDVYDGRDVKYNNVYWDCLEMKYEIIGNIHESPELLNN